MASPKRVKRAKERGQQTHPCLNQNELLGQCMDSLELFTCICHDCIIRIVIIPIDRLLLYTLDYQQTVIYNCPEMYSLFENRVHSHEIPEIHEIHEEGG